MQFRNSPSRRHLRTLASLFSASCLLFGATIANAENVHSDLVSRLNSMELCVFGSTHRDEVLETRLSTLEIEAFGHAKTGPAIGRLQALEKTVGKRSVTSEFLPPVAPQLDLGTKTPDLAPQRQGTDGSPNALAARTPNNHPEKRPQAIEQKASVDAAKIDGLIKDGVAKHSAGDDAAAEKIFKDVLTKSPFNPNACYNLGVIAEQRGDLASALGEYRTALISNPNDPQLQAAVAQVEDEIAHKQTGPFQNPLVMRNGDQTVLRGGASEFGTNRSMGFSGGAVSSGHPATYPDQQTYAGQCGQQALQQNVSQQPPVRRSAGAFSGKIFGAAAEAAVGLAAAGARGGNPGNFINALHCPICRLLH